MLLAAASLLSAPYVACSPQRHSRLQCSAHVSPGASGDQRTRGASGAHRRRASSGRPQWRVAPASRRVPLVGLRFGVSTPRPRIRRSSACTDAATRGSCTAAALNAARSQRLCSVCVLPAIVARSPSPARAVDCGGSTSTACICRLPRAATCDQSGASPNPSLQRTTPGRSPGYCR